MQTDIEANAETGTLSIIIPAYNEARRMPETLRRVREFAAGRAASVEVIVCDDGSTDGTSEAVRRFMDTSRAAPDRPCLRIELLRHERNRGKGLAVRRGVQAARGEHLLICDADLSGPLDEFEKLYGWLEHGFDIVLGSRDLPDSRLDPPQPPVRRWLAWGFRALRRRLLLPGIRDTQCGFKLFRAAAARDVFARARVDGWLFDCEVLALAELRGYRLKEVGIRWQNDPDSRVRPQREVWRTLRDLLAIRRRVRAAGREGDRWAREP